MKELKIIFFFIVIITTGCDESIEDYAYDWSLNVKEKILKEINEPEDSIEVDSTDKNWHEITYWKENRKLKTYNYRPIDRDTVVSIFFSKNQDFELVRELCSDGEIGFEGIRYKGNHLGFARFKDCDKGIIESGFRLEGDVGLWKKFNKDGKLIKTTDFENVEKLNRLRKIKYE